MTKSVDASGLVKAVRGFESKAAPVMVEALTMCADLVVGKAKVSTLFKDKSSQLRRSIQRGDINAAKADVEAGRAVKYAKWVHDGTQGPYVIRPNRRKALRFIQGGAYRFAKAVQHPGLKPRPFLTNALEESKPQINEIISDAVEIALLESGFTR